MQVSCCVVSLAFGSDGGLLPENCQLEACPTMFDSPTTPTANPQPGGGAQSLIATPLAIASAILVAIVTHV